MVVGDKWSWFAADFSPSTKAGHVRARDMRRRQRQGRSGIRKRASKFFCNCCCGHRLWAAAEKRPASDVVRAEGGSEWDPGASQRAQASLQSFGARVLRRLTSQAENASSSFISVKQGTSGESPH